MVHALCIQAILPQQLIAEAVATRHSLQLVGRDEVVACKDGVGKVGEDKCRLYHVLPLPVKGGVPRVAVADPEIHGFATIKNTLRQIFRNGSIQFVVASIEDMTEALDRLRLEQRAADATHEELMPTPAMIEQDIERAFREGASDLHLKPGENWHAVTIRVDGVCKEIRRISMPAHKSNYISLLKLSSGRGPHGEDRAIVDEGPRSRTMDPGNVHEAKNSASVREFGGKRVALRYNSIPTPRGESIALRLIDHAKIWSMRLGDLGYLPPDVQLLVETFRGHTGLNLFLGTTGSGKSTSLYCGIKEVDTNAFRVVTVEDPIECLFPEGPIQIEVTPQLPFNAITEEVVRHDPDVIVVSEVRSEITARLLTWATLSGHLTWSTLHADTPFLAIHRLLDLNLPIRNFAGAINVFCAQRLAKRVCTHCRREHPRNRELLAEHRDLLAQYADIFPQLKVPAPTFYMAKPGGCERCRCKGEFGRVLFAELYQFDDEDKNQLIQQGADYNPLQARQRAKSRKDRPLKTIRQDAILKAALGWVTVEEAIASTLTASNDGE